MMFFGNFHFVRPAWLLFVPIVIWIWWLNRERQDPLRGWRAVMDAQLLDAVTVRPDSDTRWRDVGLLATWLLAVTSIAGPTWRPEPSPFADDPVSVMILLKADETMDRSDLSPSRMERARLKAADLSTERPGLPLGLIAYAGSAHLVLPPTRDTSVVAAMAAEISSAVMPKSGDDLAAAITLAQRTLGPRGGCIIVIADTVMAANDDALGEFRTAGHLPVSLLGIARADTPEWDAIQHAASILGANATLMTADSQDVLSLVRRTASAPVAVGIAGEGVRWAETGWWLVPLIALWSLGTFRRVENSAPSVPENSRTLT